MYSLPWPASCKSSIGSFVKSSLTFKTCFETFLLQNLTMFVPLLPTRRQSSMSFPDTSTLAFVIALQTRSSRSLTLTDDGMPEISRRSLLEYWAFAQHCFSIVWNLSDNRVFTYFVTLRSDFIWSNPSLILRSSATKSLFTESILLCKFTTSATKSWLLSLFIDSSVSAAVTS